MSADLLEAFGKPAVPQSRDNRAQVSLKHQSARSQVEWPLSVDQTTSRPNQSTPKEHTDQPLWESDNHGGEVLFDATTMEAGDDDFGDFEDPEAVVAKPISAIHDQAEVDLLDLDDLSIPDRSTQRTDNTHGISKAQTFSTYLMDASPVTTFNDKHPDEVETSTGFDDDWGTFEDADTEAPAVSTINSTSTASIARYDEQPQDEDEEWEAFEDGPSPSKTITPLPPTTTTILKSSIKQPQTISVPTRTEDENPKPHSRPTNIPPPFLLLQLLPKVYETLSTQTKTPNPTPQQTQTLATKILQTYRVTARIITGRTHRWTRDTHLSQSMRISSSTAGLKKSGMKLISLDRSESIKEDQQVIEVVRAWSVHNHVLSSCMARAKVVPKPALVALSADKLVVRVITGIGIGSGGLTMMMAKDVCAVCGLKRNERVVGIDVNVEDVFGEFWVEFWGHRDCYDFWYGFCGLLDQR